MAYRDHMKAKCGIVVSKKNHLLYGKKRIKINSRVRCRCTHKQRTHTYAWFLSCECIRWYAFLYEIFKCEQPNEAHSFQDDVLESGHKFIRWLRLHCEKLNSLWLWSYLIKRKLWVISSLLLLICMAKCVTTFVDQLLVLILWSDIFQYVS